MNFKLLAVRPLEKCGKKFLKNLQKNRIYKMYKDYIFYSDNIVVDHFDRDKPKYLSIDKIEYKNTLPKDFFGSKVNVSAIIGKNGSGKSSLVNLFVASINQISINLQLQNKLETTAKLITTGDDIYSEIYCEFFYQLDNEYYIIRVENEKFTFKTLEGNIDFDFEKFFYSNVINYSIYGFNSWELGEWIDNLFHKNDSYQIPIVINPKRERKSEGKAGIIDINNENYLLQQRLLSVVLINRGFEVTENLTVDFIELELKASKNFFIYSNDVYQKGKHFHIEIEKEKEFPKILQSNYGIYFQKKNDEHPSGLYHQLDNLLQTFKTEFKIGDIIIPNFQYKLDIYILYKVISICEKYVSYNKYIKDDGKEKYKRYSIDIDGFINKIKKSESHIVLKLKQVINFIKNYESVWEGFLNGSSSVKISVDNLSKKILTNFNPSSHSSLIEFLPPPVFKTRLYSRTNVDLLDTISSGEMQLVHSTSSVIYHLSNLNSVEKDDILVKYQYVNLILDEIELYFHPEYQRKFIKRLLDDIKRVNLNHIKGVNILIISHSPFILSDIPSQNVLFLEVNESKQAIPKEYSSDNTFAENVHEILSNGFFLDSTMGEFAKSKIYELLSFEEKDKTQLVKIEYKNKREDFVKLIELVGENYVKNILKNHLESLDEKYLFESNRFEKIERVEKEIKRLELEKKRLEDEEN